jgi:hypothetical protein
MEQREEQANMQKIFILCIILIVMISCGKQNSTNETNINEKNIQNNNIEQSSQIVAESVLFTNTKCGYKIEFTKEWLGYYFITEFDDGSIVVNFLGKSYEYSTKLKDVAQIEGRPVFVIVDEYRLENQILDSAFHIGTINGINYYYATGTSAAFPFAYSPLTGVEVAEQDVDVKTNENMTTEQKLVLEDENKAKKMFADIPNILKTFTVIE